MRLRFLRQPDRRLLFGFLPLGFLLFLLLPILFSLALSFCEWNLLTWPPRFIGLENYRRLIADAAFWHYVFNTTFFMLGIPFGILGSLMLAILLNQN